MPIDRAPWLSAEVGDRTLAAVERSLAAKRTASTEQAARLIEACLEVMQATQDLDPPVAAILKQAGLPTKALYRLFPSKTDLLLAVWGHVVAVTVAVIDERIERAATPEAQLFAWVDGLVSCMSRRTTATPITLSSAAYAARFPDVIPYPHPALLAPLRQALEMLAASGSSDAVAGPHDTALVVFDLVSNSMTRALVSGTPPSEHDLALLHGSVRRVVGLR
jgi:AcrR family transcriptional regulator